MQMINPFYQPSPEEIRLDKMFANIIRGCVARKKAKDKKKEAKKKEAKENSEKLGLYFAEKYGNSNKTDVTGVFRSDNRFKAEYYIPGDRCYLGLFDTYIEAVIARREAEEKHGVTKKSNSLEELTKKGYKKIKGGWVKI